MYKKQYIAQVPSSPGSADGSFNASGSFIVAAKHAVKKVFGLFSLWRSPKKSYSPTMAAKSVRYSQPNDGKLCSEIALICLKYKK